MHCCIFCEGRALRQQLRSHKWRNDAVAVADTGSSSHSRTWFVKLKLLNCFTKELLDQNSACKWMNIEHGIQFSLVDRIQDCPSKSVEGHFLCCTSFGDTFKPLYCLLVHVANRDGSYLDLLLKGLNTVQPRV